MIKSPLVGKVQPSPERLAVQMRYMERRYDDVLGKVLEQNALILDSVARMQDELKNLRTKLESLEISVQEEAVPKVNGVDSRSTENNVLGQHGTPSPSSGIGGPPLASMPPPFSQAAAQFYNPYAHPMYNPYMMMPDPMSYFMNPTMLNAAMYGALNQNTAAPTLIEPPRTPIPPFSFGVQLPSAPVDSSPATSNGTVNMTNLSYVSPKPPGTEAAHVQDTPIATATYVPPKQLPAADSIKKLETPSAAGSISFGAPKQPQTAPALNLAPSSVTSSTVTASPATVTLVSKPPAQATPPKPIFTAQTQPAPAKPDSGIGVISGTIGSNKPFSFGFTQAGSTPSATSINANNLVLNPPKADPVVSKPLIEKKPEPLKEDKAFVDFSTLYKPGTEGANPFGSWRGFGAGGTTTQPMFGSPSPAEVSSIKEKPQPASPLAANKSVTEEHEDDFVPTAEFAPVIPLPPLVEVKKGDENENVLFKHRAKLLRFVRETKEWKERGLGDIKILQSKDNEKKIRVVMWREKVHKIACNHWVTKEMEVNYYQGNLKNLQWTAIDFADTEEGPRTEIFVCKFGQEDTAKEFKKQMDHAISIVDKTPVTPEKAEPVSKVSAQKVEDSKPVTLAPLSSMFKKPEGQWSCEACYTDNKKESIACVACSASKPGLAPESSTGSTPSTTTASVALPKFTFGFNVPAVSAPPKVENNQSTIFTLKSSSILPEVSAAKPALIKQSQTEKEIKVEASTPAPKPFLDFSKLSSEMPSFGNLATINTSPFGSNKGFGSGTVQPVFGSPVVPAARRLDGASDSPSAVKSDEPEDDFVPTAQFEPVIPLPPIVEVKKGDENENVLFSHRAKLLRFVTETKEWKERGVGDIKILQAKDNPKKIRVVMWREKVHKIACNHWVTPDLEIKNYQENAKNLMWTAVDFAEADEGAKGEIFVCRFGHEDKAQEFKAEMNRAVGIVANAGATPERPKEEANVKESSSAVQIKPLSELFKKPEGEWSCDACYCSNSKDRSTCVSCNSAKPQSSVTSTGDASSEGKNSSDLIEKAERLKLPSNYFTLECDNSDHPPCRGCDPDAFDFSVLDGRKVPMFEDIPKPTRDSLSTTQGNETLKELLTKNTPNDKSASQIPKSSLGSGDSSISTTSAPSNAASALSSFSFSLPSASQATSAPTTSSSSTDFKINVPTFSFTPNFTFTPEKTSVLGSNSIFGSGFGVTNPDSNVPTTIASLNNEPEENGDEEEGEDEDDEEEDTMFLNEGHAYFKEADGDFVDYGEGQVKILYDGDQFCARFWFSSNDDEDLFVDHIIAAETQVQATGENTFEWDCICYVGNNSSKGRVRVKFPDQQAFDSFASTMSDSVDIAMQAGVTEADLSIGGEHGNE